MDLLRKEKSVHDAWERKMKLFYVDVQIEREEKTAGDGGDEGDGKNGGEDGERDETPAEETAATGEVSVGVAKDEEEGVVKEEEVGVAPSVVESADSNIGTTSRPPLDNIIEEEEEEEEEEQVDRDELIIDCRVSLTPINQPPPSPSSPWTGGTEETGEIETRECSASAQDCRLPLPQEGHISYIFHVFYLKNYFTSNISLYKNNSNN